MCCHLMILPLEPLFRCLYNAIGQHITMKINIALKAAAILLD